MADIRSSQVIAQVETQAAPLIKSTQLVVQVEYEETPFGTYTGDVTLALTPDSDTTPTFVYTGDISCSLTPGSEYGVGNFFYGNIPISLIPEADTSADIVYNGDITVTFVPEADIISDFGYEGHIPVELSLSSAYSTPILGFDWYSGYGFLDLTFLDGNPPYYAVYGDIPVTVTPASAIELYAEYEVTATGGVGFAGAGTATFSVPPIFEAVASGGIRIAGIGTVEHVTPPTFEVVASGRVCLAGRGTVEFYDPEEDEEEAPVFEVVGSGGVKVSGKGTAEFPELVIYEVTASGGIAIHGAGTIEFPALPEDFVVVAAGGVKVSSQSVFEFFVPDVVFELVASGGIEVGGQGLFIYTSPLVFEFVGSGGVEIGGEYEAYLYHTWVITGLTFEPAIYSGFDFNSYSEYQGKYYGLKSDGLYLLEGDTDDGGVIHSGVNFGANNFGKEGRNRLRSIRFGDRDGDDINIKVASGSQEDFADLSRNRKTVVSRSVFGDDLDISIADFESLGSMELAVVYRK